MDKSFDDLFNEFFDNSKSQQDERMSRIKDEISHVMKILSKFKDVTNDEDYEKELDETLGKPDSVKLYTEDGLYYEEKTWHTSTGDFVKIVASDNPNDFKQSKVDVTQDTIAGEKVLQEQLAEAIAKEDFEKAAEIRDLLNPPKKKRTRKVSTSESVEPKKRKPRTKKTNDENNSKGKV